MNSKTKDFRQQIADAFIKSLEEKQLNWKQGWRNISAPTNAITNKRYRGINMWWLQYVANERGYTDTRWCTFKQIQSKNWKLKKGAKGVKVEYWMPFDKSIGKCISWEEYRNKINANPKTTDMIITSKYYTVFNGTDIEGIPEVAIKNAPGIEPSELVEKLSHNMNVMIYDDGNDNAFYRPSTDTIHLPPLKSFISSYEYNATALHELAHATGHTSRLNRNMDLVFGSSDYAYEELIAEISSCFMSSNLHIESTPNHINNHKAYVQSWIQAINAKPETLFKAIREAEKVANYMEYKAELMTEQEYTTTLSDTQSMEVSVSKEIANVINKSEKPSMLMQIKKNERLLTPNTKKTTVGMER